MNWDYKRTERKFESVPAGDHRVVIDSVEQAVSKNGNDMLVFKLRVSGCSSMLWHYVVFMDNHPEITNQKLTEIFDSFGIPECNFNLASYVGKTGAAHVKIDDQGYPKVSYFIRKDKQGKLPPWEGDLPDFKPVEMPKEDLW